MNKPSSASIVLTAFTHQTMTVEKLADNTMLTKKKVSDALEELSAAGRVTVAGGAWTLVPKKKGSIDVTPSAIRKSVTVAGGAWTLVPKKKGSIDVTPSAIRKSPAKKAVATKKTPDKKAPAKKVVAAKKAPAVKKATTPTDAAVKRHAKVAERDDKVLTVITSSASKGITDEEIATKLKVSLGIAYQSIRRLKDENKITSKKGANGVTRRYV
jgi:predicted transcriptional regulator